MTARDMAILDLESRTFRRTGSKWAAIRRQTGMTRIAYYARLNALLDMPEAVAYAPITVNRLRRLRVSA